MTGSSSAVDPSRLHFHVLDREQQEQAIRRLATAGMTDNDIGRVTGWAVQAIRRVLGERQQ